MSQVLKMAPVNKAKGALEIKIVDIICMYGVRMKSFFRYTTTTRAAEILEINRYQ